MSDITEAFGAQHEEPDIQVDTPINLRPNLSDYGIEEVDRGICIDSFENRQALRRARLNWIPVYAVNGVPTGQIQALSPEMQTQQRILSIQEKEAILADPTSKNSDYLTGFDLLAEEAADNIVPPWVLGATRVWGKEQNDGGPKGTKKPANLPHRCNAVKVDGLRCQLWTGGRPQDDGLCRIHLGSLRNKPTDSIERARERLTQAAPSAVDMLETLMENAESEPVKLKAATEILDRAGVRGGIEVDTTVNLDVRPAASIIAERLLRLSPKALAVEEAELIVDAEEVSEEPEKEKSDTPVEVVDNDDSK